MAKLLILSLFLSQLATAADPTAIIYAGCSQSRYEPNSPYQSNVDSLLSSVANAASSSPYGKFTSDTASSSSPAYGVFQCRGDLDTATCQSCVRSALSHLSPLCPSSSGAALQLDGCFVRYDNESFIGKEETNLLYKNCGPNPRNGLGLVKALRYDANLVGMRDDALSAIVSSGSTGGTYRVSASGFVQAAAQCVGDLSAKDCSDCISNAINQLKTLCGDAVSGEVYLGKCFAKYYSGGGSSSSAEDGGGGGGGGGGRRYSEDSAQKAGKTIAIIIGLMVGVALIIVFASFIRRRTRNSKH